VRDRTQEREMARQDEEETNNQLQLLIDNIPVLVAYIDTDFIYKLGNAFYKTLHGIDQKELIGLHLKDVIGEEGFAVEKVKYERAFAGETIVSVDHFVTNLGINCWYQVTIIPHFESGKVRGVFSLVVDLTEQKQLESDIRKAKDTAEAANRAKSTFLANMSHELRTPLSAILGFTRLLIRDVGQNKEQQERLDIINRSGEHLLGMVDDILSLSKIEAGRIELKQDTFDVTQMLQDVGQMMTSRAEDKGLRFTLEIDPALPSYVQGDSGKLRQVLINLLGNAVKFTETGDVWLRARSQPVADDPDRAMLQLEAQDTGPGIAQDRLDEIFDNFVQLDRSQSTEGGTGLGLAISKTLVDMMDGEITVESQVGKGSLFTVNIPFQLAEAGPKIPSEAPVAEVTGLTSGQPDWRILVVDDNKENRLLLRDLLSRVGFDIKEAKDGEDAIARFQQWQPHFIWMDMRMPVMDGYAATRKIRELPGGAEVNIVAVTASALAEDREDILASGCEDVVRKPFRNHEIFDAMARHLGVQYLYRERGRETGRDQDINLTPEMLDELPGELLEELRGTTLALDREATLEVIERIKAQAPETAEGLQNMVESLQMGKLGELLKEV